MKSKKYKRLGFILVVIGIIFAAISLFTEFNFLKELEMQWSVAIIFMVGISFEVAFFTGNRRYGGLLIAGGIICISSFVLFFEQATNYEYSQYVWPFYVLAVSIGFFQQYIFSSKNRGTLFVAQILFAVFVVGLIFSIVDYMNYTLTWSLLLGVVSIFTGLFIWFFKPHRKNVNWQYVDRVLTLRRRNGKK